MSQMSTTVRYILDLCCEGLIEMKWRHVSGLRVVWVYTGTPRRKCSPCLRVGHAMTVRHRVTGLMAWRLKNITFPAPEGRDPSRNCQIDYLREMALPGLESPPLTSQLLSTAVGAPWYYSTGSRVFASSVKETIGKSRSYNVMKLTFLWTIAGFLVRAMGPSPKQILMVQLYLIFPIHVCLHAIVSRESQACRQVFLAVSSGDILC